MKSEPTDANNSNRLIWSAPEQEMAADTDKFGEIGPNSRAHVSWVYVPVTIEAES